MRILVSMRLMVRVNELHVIHAILYYSFLALFVLVAVTQYSRSVQLVSSTLRHTQYRIVFDAGSTGTRVNGFKFKCSRTHCQLRPPTVPASVAPGLSSFAESPEGARRGLAVLVEEAHRVARGRVSVFFGATAGLRLLPEEQREGLLQVAQQEIGRRFGEAKVQVIDGKEEALFQYLTFEFLTKDEKALIVDLGGASVQVAYKCQSTKHMSDAEMQYMHMMDNEKYLFVHSWLGYGLRAARMKILQFSFACVHTPFSYTNANETIEAQPPSVFSVDSCFEQTEKAMRIGDGCDGDLQPCAFDGGWRGPMNHEHNVFLFSFIFDISKRLGLFPEGSHDNSLTVRQIVEAAKKECNQPSSDEFLCLDAVYISSLIHKALGLALDKSVRVLNKLLYDGHLFEGAWALGAALSHSLSAD